MANQLRMAIVQSILHLHSLQWSQRRIARELGIHRETVGRYLLEHLDGAKPAIPPTGSGGSKPATISPAPGPPAEGNEAAGDAEEAGGPNPAISPAGSVPPTASPAGPTPPGRPTACQPYREIIQAKLDQQLSAQRIWQDLRDEHGFGASYDSVKRFVRRLGRSRPLPFRRLECPAGQQAQVDFGRGAPVISAEGRRRTTWVFRIVLSHSRKAYAEVTFRQTTDDFLCALENAFGHFGGVPATLVIDNLRAAVKQPDWFDPLLVPKLEAFCRHYGTTILPTRPYMPRHKGKIEAGVKYVKNNALKGRTFTSLEEQNRHLAAWETRVADTRIHGTTRRQVGQVFEQEERHALRPLPVERFADFREGQRKVSRDGHVEVAGAYYSVPPEYLAREVWVRWDARLVRVFNARFEQIALHVRHQQGRFSTHAAHLAREKISGLERGAAYLLEKVSAIGPQSQAWAEAMLTARGIEGTRVLQGLLSLTKKHRGETLEKACEIALSHGCCRLRSIRQLLKRQTDRQETLEFLSEHPLIRPLDDYAAVVARAIQRREDRSSLSEGFKRHDRTKAALGLSEQESLAASAAAQQGFAVLPPRPGYPSPGCSSAEPGSVSPDPSSVVPPHPLQEPSP